jgi:hypothetical protein
MIPVGGDPFLEGGRAVFAYTFTDVLAERTQLFVNCADPLCGHSAEADVQVLADKFGADHGVTHDDLVGLFRCRRCKDADRPRYAVCFALVPDYGSMDRSRGHPRGDGKVEPFAVIASAACGPCRGGDPGETVYLLVAAEESPPIGCLGGPSIRTSAASAAEMKAKRALSTVR